MEVHWTTTGDANEHVIRFLFVGGYAEGGNNGRMALQSIKRRPPLKRGMVRVDRAKMVELHQKEKVPPTMRVMDEVFEEEEPLSADNDHKIPIRVHREDMKPVPE